MATVRMGHGASELIPTRKSCISIVSSLSFGWRKRNRAEDPARDLRNHCKDYWVIASYQLFGRHWSGSQRDTRVEFFIVLVSQLQAI